MSERVVPITSGVSTGTLRKAVRFLDTRKHPEKLKVIDQELIRRKAA